MIPIPAEFKSSSQHAQTSPMRTQIADAFSPQEHLSMVSALAVSTIYGHLQCGTQGNVPGDTFVRVVDSPFILYGQPYPATTAEDNSSCS